MAHAGNERVCEYCDSLKVCVDSGRRLKDGTKILVDQNGARWAGKRCPACEHMRVKSALKWNKFERSQIFKKLKDEGYSVIRDTAPILVSKNGNLQKVRIAHASAENGKLILEENYEEADLHVLVFSTLRLLSNRQLAAFNQVSSHEAARHEVML